MPFSAIFFCIIPTESFVTLQFPEKRTKCDGPITASIALPPYQAEVESRIILKHPKLSSPKQRPSIKLVRYLKKILETLFGFLILCCLQLLKLFDLDAASNHLFHRTMLSNMPKCLKI